MSNQKSSNTLYAVADFCLIPMGLPTPSVGPQIAECQRVLEKSGLEYRLHGYGTNVEGPWDKVMETDIRIGTRTDREISSGGNDHKKARVEEILAKKE
ncbi:unnamed protein product [Cutaneotrichosporon oleaginosum]